MILLVLLPGSISGAAAQDSAAHPPPDPTAVTEPDAVLKVTGRVLCMCGTCVNQTLHECTCGTAAGEREKIAAAVAAGKDPNEIIQGYVDNYGPQILIEPDKKGFNLLGWLVPFIATLVGLAALTLVLRGWIRRSAEAPARISPAGSDDPADAEYRARLERELKEFKV